ncbi:MAG: ABC transporter ATP-binding protein [Oscillospiraceae bacterium]|nr:ABC transporter ATP-binding protein [Oscillospiraceae bacterium]
MMEELMLKIDNVSKQYVLGQIGGTTLRDELQRRRAKRRGEEDPTRTIGARDYKQGETFLALDGVSIDVKKGERVGIIGHNGAGKSTLLKLISRVTAPTGGRIGLNGRVVSMLEVGTGFHGELTGRENIYMNGAILGMKKKEIDAKLEDIIEFSECRQFIDTPVKRYSSGMYVKLAFSVAAHLDAEIMIMDEILAVGDMAFQKKCLEKMNDVSRTEGRTILYVSHNMNTIRQLCDRVIVLDHGKVVFDGDVEDGIGAYMGSVNNGFRLFNDCSRLPREKYADGSIVINSVEILDVQEPAIYSGENVSVEIKYSSNRDYSSLAFRMILFSENRVIVGMTSTESIIYAKRGNNSLKLQFDLSVLASGIYYARIVLYEIDSFAGEVIHDVVQDAFCLVIDKRNNQNSTNKMWKKGVWGNIQFPDAKVIECGSI